jgi:ketosteroid isomerase-like protein
MHKASLRENFAIGLWLGMAFLAVAILLGSVAAAAGQPAEIALVQKYFDAMRAKDRAAVEALLTPDAVFEYAYSRTGATAPGSEKRFTGRDTVMREFVDRAFQIMSKIDWQDPVYTLSADGQTVFVEMRGDMVLGKDVPYRNRYVARFDLREGSITGMREYMNPVTAGQALEAAGLLK